MTILCPACGDDLVGPMYFANPTRASQSLMTAGVLGYIDTPAQGNRRPFTFTWCADNGCFSENFNERQWFTWLRNNTADASLCRFAVAPDVVGDAVATLARSGPWFDRIRELSFPVAFVAQDGIEHTVIPWDDFDVLFIGGSTEFKLGVQAAEVIGMAHHHGKQIHMGRVNSKRRFNIAAELGVHSVDGTFLTFAPSANVPRLLSWLHDKPCAA